MLATSLAGQVTAAQGDHRQAACLHFNVAGAADSSRCTGIAWLSPERGTFAAGHSSGALFFYQKKVLSYIRVVLQVEHCNLTRLLWLSPDHGTCAAGHASGALFICQKKVLITEHLS